MLLTLQSTFVVGNDYDECHALEVECEGECCDANLPRFDTQRCPGYYNPETWCQESPDFCMPTTYNNTNSYTPSTGAAEQCYLQCPPMCSDNEMTCYGKYSDGCEYSYCMNGTYGYDGYARQLSDYGDYGNDSCPITCPAECSEFDIICSNGVDQNGCSYGDFCMPATYPLWEGVECQAVCPSSCDRNAGEVMCFMYSDEGCPTGNYCVVGGLHSSHSL